MSSPFSPGPLRFTVHLSLRPQIVLRASTTAVAVVILLTTPMLEAGQSNSSFSVGATVVEYTRVKTLTQQSYFNVEIADIKRGYIELPLASAMSIRTNRKLGHRLVIEAVQPAFSHMQVSGPGLGLTEVNGRALINLPPMMGEAVYRLNYRILLTPEIPPGRYDWPYLLYVEPV